MDRAVYDVQVVLTALHHVADFANFGCRNFARRTGQRVDAADFLDGRRRNREELTADAKQNDLFAAHGLGFDGSGESHYFTPTGVLTPTGATLLMPMTRFSIAA